MTIDPIQSTLDIEPSARRIVKFPEHGLYVWYKSTLPIIWSEAPKSIIQWLFFSFWEFKVIENLPLWAMDATLVRVDWEEVAWVIGFWMISTRSLLKKVELLEVCCSFFSPELAARPWPSLDELRGFQSAGLPYIYQQRSFVSPGLWQWLHQGLPFFFCLLS